MKKVLTNH